MGALAQAGMRDVPVGAGMLNLMNFQGRHRNGRGVSNIRSSEVAQRDPA